ncbi:anti-sigma factor [Promicromonospora iranensis]|uniref:Regulator of SigK n=1 Tax=Promicromonospora iranensis TaxID=1105144 RepID=A0ABU2CRF1_9MICO|nr:anti-sigma factor [Promicromonospora iranensis]MDR7383918.1 anti-sigma-K factor RskA [Promicromonospora iranensis]
MSDRSDGGTRGDAQGDARDLLPGYALHALDDLERRSVDRLLESDADARRALDEYHEVVASFTVDTEPPAGLRASVLDRVRNTPQVSSTSAPSGSSGTVESSSAAAVPPADGPAAGGGGDIVDLSARRRTRRWGVALTAVAAAAAVAVPTTIAVQATAERDRLREQSEIVSEMLVDPDASILRGTVEGGGQASVLVADDDMFFRADDLPEPAPGRAYQLWVVAEDGSVSSAGVLSVRDGETASLIQGVEGIGMAVTVEPEAGSEQPTTDPVVVLGA